VRRRLRPARFSGAGARISEGWSCGVIVPLPGGDESGAKMAGAPAAGKAQFAQVMRIGRSFSGRIAAASSEPVRSSAAARP
jgi:hypothetical protein